MEDTSKAASLAVVPAGARASVAERRKGKQTVLEDGTEEERTPIIVDMARARGVIRVRLLAVGVFLSIMAIPSKQLVNYMKKVWRIRGLVESNQLADRRFILEFSEVGDFEHVTRGGSWRHQKDAVLIRALKEGEDPNEVKFETVPIWVQFTDIPFYLLSKELARNLGKKLGELISIDNNARGNICEKILRARIKLPVARALQRWIILKDESTDEDVVVSVFYERLPTFCLCRGVIGHQEAGCDLPTALRRRRYEPNLGVSPTHIDDPRSWYLAATAGENGRALQLPLPWRVVQSQGERNFSTRAPQQAAIAHVVNEVEKLTVQEKVQERVNTSKNVGPGTVSTAASSGSQTPGAGLALVDCENSINKIANDIEATGIAKDAIVLIANDNTIQNANFTNTKETNGTDKTVETTEAKKSWMRRAREGGAGHDKNPPASPSPGSTLVMERKTELAPAMGVSVLGKRAPTDHGVNEHGSDKVDISEATNYKKNKAKYAAEQR